MNGEKALKITIDIIENLRDTKKYKNLKQSRYLGILIDQVIKSRLTSDYTTPNIINPLNNCISKLLLAFFDSNHEKLSQILNDEEIYLAKFFCFVYIFTNQLIVIATFLDDTGGIELSNMTMNKLAEGLRTGHKILDVWNLLQISLVKFLECKNILQIERKLEILLESQEVIIKGEKNINSEYNFILDLCILIMKEAIFFNMAEELKKCKKEAELENPYIKLMI